MISSIKIKFHILFLILQSALMSTYAQTKVYGGLGTATVYTQQSQKMIASKNDLSLAGMQWHIGIEHQKKRSSFMGSFSFYSGLTMIRVSDTYREGFYGSTITRFDLGYTYNILKINRKIFIKPFVMLGIQQSKKTNDFLGYRTEILRGSNYFQIATPSLEVFKTTQIIPSLGVRAGIKISKKVAIGLNIQGVYAFKTYQKIIFEYTYKDDPTPRKAVFDSKGTGLFSSIFVSFDIPKKNQKKKK